MVIDISLYQLDIDVERTAQYYQNATGILCDCDGCQNYEQAATTLPAPVLQFLCQFGIDPAKPAEVSVNYAPSQDTVHYSGFYYICGRILKGTNPWIQTADRHFQFDTRYKINLCENHSVFFTNNMLVLDNDIPTPVVQVEIDFILSWMLDKPNSYL